eukprot:3497807-Prymnesium_polylepis.1
MIRWSTHAGAKTVCLQRKRADVLHPMSTYSAPGWPRRKAVMISAVSHSGSKHDGSVGPSRSHVA